MNIKSNQDKLHLLCTKSKYGNFKAGKVYEATAYASMGKQFTDFRIEDEDGDLFTIQNKYLLNKGPLLFQIVEKTLKKPLEQKENLEEEREL